MAVNLRNDDAIARELRSLQTIALKLENYDGSNPCADWLSDFDRYVTETARDSDEAKLFSLIYHLTGTAKEWFNLLSDDIKESYKKLRDALWVNCPTDLRIVHISVGYFPLLCLQNCIFSNLIMILIWSDKYMCIYLYICLFLLKA